MATWYAFLRLPSINGTWVVKEIALTLDRFNVTGDTGAMTISIPKSQSIDQMMLMYLSGSEQIKVNFVMYDGQLYLYDSNYNLINGDLMYQISLLRWHLTNLPAAVQIDNSVLAYLYFRTTNAPLGDGVNHRNLAKSQPSSSLAMYSGAITTYEIAIDPQSNPRKATCNISMDVATNIT